MEELVQFLQKDQRKDVKNAACAEVLKLTGTHQGVTTIAQNLQLLGALVTLVRDPDDSTRKNAVNTLVNISSYEAGARALLEVNNPDIVAEMVELIKDRDYAYADCACGVLSNLTRNADSCAVVLKMISRTPMQLDGLVYILCQENYNKHGAKLNLLASLITNLTQISDGRSQLMMKDRCILERLLPFTQYKACKERRKSIVAAIRNCCFEKEYHEWLLSDDMDVASHLCLPLAGPDVYTSEENETLPLDLQYLPDDKTREPDEEIRILLLEALMQLSATKSGRERLRACNIYLILREHHKWEVNEKCIELNEDVVNLLIRTEEEIGCEDLSSLEIPEDVRKKFQSGHPG